MLASLLPGMRHLRTPFAVGALCAFQVWLIAGEVVPSRADASDFVKRICELGDLAGRPIATAAVGFFVYLIGDIMRLSTKSFLTIKRITRIRPTWTVPPTEVETTLLYFARRAYVRRSIDATEPDLAFNLQSRIFGELPEIRMRLIAEHMDIYLEHDRFESEADFRLNVATFSTSLWVLLAFYWSPWSLVGLIASLSLYRKGSHALHEANRILVQAVVSEVVKSRYFEEEKNIDEQTSQRVFM